MDKALQTGLAAGMSTVSGFHSEFPNRPGPSTAGQNTLPAEYCPDAKARISFPAAKGPVEASHICIGAWPWGDKSTFYWKDEELPAVHDAWKTLYHAGINFIDTAEAYGNGESEVIVGKVVAGLPRDSFVIQTKYLGHPAAISNIIHPIDAPVRSLKKSLERMKLEFVDIYMVHGNIHPQSMTHVAEGMAKCVEQGLARAIAIANHDTEDMLKMRDLLAKHNVPLAANQCEFSVLRRYPELHGTIAACHKNNIVFQSYSSLAQGRLLGKYTIDHPPPKTYRFSSYAMKDLEPTIEVLRSIAQKHGKSVASVALNYNISKGALPLVGIRNVEQAKDAVEALGWRLSNE